MNKNAANVSLCKNKNGAYGFHYKIPTKISKESVSPSGEQTMTFMLW